MQQPLPASAKADSASRFLVARQALAAESPDALNKMAALAESALADGDLPLAAAAAGAVVLAEHLQSALYRHAARMLGVLATTGPDAAATGSDGLFAWAGAAVAHDYGVLPSWPRADVAMLMERAQRAPTDVALALACALGEVCERNGADADFAALQAQAAAFEVQPGASPFWRGHWAIVCAWQLASFARVDDALEQLKAAQTLAAAHGLVALGATAALQRARLVECHRDPAQALELADRAVASGDPARTPLWFADQADVRCRVALRALDFHAAVGHARRSVGYLRAGAVWPGFQLTYRVTEAYALLGTGAIDEALACLNSLRETPHPRYLAARLQSLSDLVALIAADQRGDWTVLQQEALADVIRGLRELEWPSILPLLPQHVARLFARALASDVEPDWVRAAIRTRGLPAPPGAPEAWPWAVKIRTLGGFEAMTEGESLGGRARDTRKASSKPLELLRYLAAQGHDVVSVDVIAQALWPGDGREGRQKAFDITVARLRRLLDCDPSVTIYDHRAGLNSEFVWVDVQTLNERLAEGEAAIEGSTAANAALEAALILYRGPCLADSTQAWARAAGDRVRERLAAALMRAMRSASVSTSQGREWTLRAMSADPQLGVLLDRDRSR
jgi:hypothetical protein